MDWKDKALLAIVALLRGSLAALLFVGFWVLLIELTGLTGDPGVEMFVQTVIAWILLVVGSLIGRRRRQYHGIHTGHFLARVSFVFTTWLLLWTNAFQYRPVVVQEPTHFAWFMVLLVTAIPFLALGMDWYQQERVETGWERPEES